MRLSDAIALGRVLVMPKAGSEYFHNGSGCARGMALEGCGVGRVPQEGSSENWRKFIVIWGWTLKTAPPCPCGCAFSGKESFCHHIAHLFDDHVAPAEGFNLDQLIDWVRSVEPAKAEVQPAQVQETVAVSVGA